MDYWESLAKITNSIITSTAILIGGIWAYFNFVRGRVYKPRLELDVKCKRGLQANELVRLHVTIVIKNVGLSRVGIDTESSAVRIHNILKRDDLIKALEPKWRRIGTFQLFVQHQWIEPSEIIRNEKIIECKSADPIFKIEAIVMSKTQQWYNSAISAGAMTKPRKWRD